MPAELQFLAWFFGAIVLAQVVLLSAWILAKAVGKIVAHRRRSLE